MADELGSQTLDDSEEEEEFILEFVVPEYAINVNNTANHKDKINANTFSGMVLRENKVLEMIKEELL